MEERFGLKYNGEGKAWIIDGKAISDRIKEEVKQRLDSFIQRSDRPVGIAAILVGDDPASKMYMRMKTKACDKLGFLSETIYLEESTDSNELLKTIEELGKKDEIDGILVQRPLPPHIDAYKVYAAIPADKDPDCFNPQNVARLLTNQYFIAPATPYGIIHALKTIGIQINGARAVVLGRSDIVGKPMAILLMHNNATVTICHSRTRDIENIAKEADILVAAMGRACKVNGSWIKQGATVIDVGINEVTDPAAIGDIIIPDSPKAKQLKEKGYTMVGDVDFESAQLVAGCLTPVPGGVGPLTIATLLENTMLLAERRLAN